MSNQTRMESAVLAYVTAHKADEPNTRTCGAVAVAMQGGLTGSGGSSRNRCAYRAIDSLLDSGKLIRADWRTGVLTLPE